MRKFSKNVSHTFKNAPESNTESICLKVLVFMYIIVLGTGREPKKLIHSHHDHT